MQIEMTIEQLKNFLPKLESKGGGVKSKAILRCIPILERSLLNNVFKKSHSDTVQIWSMNELGTLIARGVNHKPAQARRGKPYSKKYLALKKRLGENMPHKFMDYGFWHGIHVMPRGSSAGASLIMQVKPILHRGFNYMEHHEKRRSVLKRAFLDAWQKMIDMIIKIIAEEATSI